MPNKIILNFFFKQNKISIIETQEIEIPRVSMEKKKKKKKKVSMFTN